jgi:predicted amino acid dehydrogenase
MSKKKCLELDLSENNEEDINEEVKDPGHIVIIEGSLVTTSQ